MKKTLVIVLGLIVIFYLGLLTMQTLFPSDEVSNIEDLKVSPETPDPPEFYVSNQALLKETKFKVVSKINAEKPGSNLAGIPYFIQLSDGEYSFGHTNAYGSTRLIYMKRKETFKVFWYGEALQKWMKRPEPVSNAIKMTPIVQP